MQYIAGIIQKKVRTLEVGIGEMFGTSDRGSFFKFQGHQTLLKENKTYHAQALGGGNIGLDLIFARPKLKTFHSIDEIESLENGGYGLPYASNFPLIDAVIQPNILLQFTITRNTGV